jgi:hypothetical protein
MLLCVKRENPMDARKRGQVQKVQPQVDREVYTYLGKGRIVYQLPNGTLVVEFEHGGGHIFMPSELFAPDLGVLNHAT